MTCHECDPCFLPFGVSHHKPPGMQLHQRLSFDSIPFRLFVVQSVRSRRQARTQVRGYGHGCAHTHTHTTANLSYQPSTVAVITMINRATLTTRPIHCQCLCWALSLAALDFLPCFPTMHCKEYQPRVIWRAIRCPCGAKLTPSPHDTVQLETRVGKHNSRPCYCEFFVPPLIWEQRRWKEEKKEKNNA